MPIHLKDARQHNLKDIDVTFGDGLTVVTGVSGSGKTSLVFDTLYHEARRRFLEIYASGSTALRLSPADVGVIHGLGPAVAVGQNLLNRNPLSTLATASGIHPFLRLLYARFGQRRCEHCGTPLIRFTQDEAVQHLISVTGDSTLQVFAPLVHSTRGSHHSLLQLLQEQFDSHDLWVDGVPWGSQPLDPRATHNIDLRLANLSHSVSMEEARRLIQTVLALGAHGFRLSPDNASQSIALAPVCTGCGAWFSELEPIHFHTTCPNCKGRGCSQCDGSGLFPAAAAVRWQGLRLPDLMKLSVEEARGRFNSDQFPQAALRLQSEVLRRLDALDKVGLGYVNLDRPSPSLSRGEAQRVRLAVALTSRLEDMLHVLDEPTIGQHPADVERLLPVFRQLAGPVVYVEHDRLAASAADNAIDLGPGAGPVGGHLLYAGPTAGLWQADTPTGYHFSGRRAVLLPPQRNTPEQFLQIRGASLRNLRHIDISIPLAHLTVISGVSGSGKSTLVEDVLVASLRKKKPVGCKAIIGPALNPVLVDQDPIGRNPRSNPATYTKLSDIIRDLYAAESGLSASHFSFNRHEGACPTCSGMGAVEVKMRYLPSTWIPCAGCNGQRFSDEVLGAKVAFDDQPLSIADFYRLTVSQALQLLGGYEALNGSRRRSALAILNALQTVGLGYLTLGQASPTLSGGEAQRIKLSRFLGRTSLDGRLLVLDEPSTGLHPQDLGGLLAVLDQLVRAGASVVIVEHNTDFIRAADWVIDLGPGAGPAGGDLIYAGPPGGLLDATDSLTGQALREEDNIQPSASKKPSTRSASDFISIRGARAHNLQSVDVDFPKHALTVVTGVSGSGKSSLVGDVLEAEAHRRFLESLSMYERQSVREGPEAEVDEIKGLGVTVTITPERQLYERRATLGTTTEISHHLAALFSVLGLRTCLQCKGAMQRTVNGWHCPQCGSTAPIAQPKYFSSSTYGAACQTCHGVGTLQVPQPEKLIIHPARPLLAGAMYSPGFFPKGFLGKPYNSGHYMVLALAQRYGFDPFRTAWQDMTGETQQAFLFGDPDPLQVVIENRKGQVYERTLPFPGFYGWIRDWDVGGTYTSTVPCPECHGAGLRPEYLAVTIAGKSIYELHQLTLDELTRILEDFSLEADPENLAFSSLQIVLRRLRFLIQVGLPYLHLGRPAGTLSAGEAQRVRLAGLLGSGLTSLTILLDEPSRGLHPSEVNALISALRMLRDEGNSVIVVEHEPSIIRAADYLVEMGPGAGAAGGRLVAQGTSREVLSGETTTARWLRESNRSAFISRQRNPQHWLTIHGARSNNLKGGIVRLPLGVLVGVCGVSGSGKSTLMIDTLGCVVAPEKQTTSVAYELIQPGLHDSIEGAPLRALLVDQSRADVTSPTAYLGLDRMLRRLYVGSEDAHALGLTEKNLARTCSVCGGHGVERIDMGFLPAVYIPCETCHGTGYAPEAWRIRLNGLSLPELNPLTLDEVYDRFTEQEDIRSTLGTARAVGLGYLSLYQPGFTLSGGEAQRLKIARELGRKTRQEALYILDEPTVGQHLADVQHLVAALQSLVDSGASVMVVEHHPHLLAACDWLVELGPGGGPQGGRVVASGSPYAVARGGTPIAPYLKDVLESNQ